MNFEDMTPENASPQLRLAIKSYKQIGRHHFCLKKIADTVDHARECKANLKAGTISITEKDAQYSLRLIQDSLILSIIYYARMFGGNQGHFCLNKTKMNFPDELESIHNEIIDIRHKSVAHIDENYLKIEEIFFRIEHDNEGKLQSGYTWRHQYLAVLEVDLDNFRRLIGYVHDYYVEPELKKKEQFINKLLNESEL